MSALKAASKSVQAHEKLVYELKNSGRSSKVISEAEAILNQLKEFKSKIEGSYFTFQPIVLDKQQVTALKHSVVSFTPKTITEQAKYRIVDQLLGLLEGQVRKVLYACLLTCPWFAAVQDEVSGKAKNNILFVVYVACDKQFFSLATQHEKELCEVCEELPLCAVEVRHYCQQLHRGNVRFIEAFCCPPESIIFAAPEWLRLLAVIQPQQLLGRTFLDRCIGQAMGGIVHKKKISGRLVVRDDANLVKFCDSVRLLHYAKLAINGDAIVVWENLSPDSDDPRKPFLETLAGAFECRLPREAVLEQLLPLRDKLVEKMETISRHTLTNNTLLKDWLSGIRLNSRQLIPLPGCGDSGDKLKALLKEISADINPDDVIVLAEAGSKMYGLSTPTSDTDYIIVYRNRTEDIISTMSSLKETLDSRGKQQTVEFAAYEVRLYCEMLLKGAVNMFELLFANDVFYQSEEWKDLVAHKHLFMTEHVILQYMGFVMTHMKIIESGKHANTPREGKLFYHVFHKLLSLELFTENKPPLVYCTGEQKDFIMKIRKGPLEGDLSKDSLLALANQRLASVRKHLLGRPERLQEQGNYAFLQSWLLNVRGIELDEPLTMEFRRHQADVNVDSS